MKFKYPGDLEEIPIPHGIWDNILFKIYVEKHPDRPWIICKSTSSLDYSRDRTYRYIYHVCEKLNDTESGCRWEQYYLVFADDDYEQLSWEKIETLKKMKN